ncbi:DNA primase family protein [Methylovirgula sp. 4M-Z18]|uniref:DNA primase family protein n=1 Tax=Methylovirgula sp. 4M-Z18 TaxID=2293567 RepID=UPI001314EFC9|nr:phage/plasmid primase, P4 family [Methylovirgula sp. 4M-Z18]
MTEDPNQIIAGIVEAAVAASAEDDACAIDGADDPPPPPDDPPEPPQPTGDEPDWERVRLCAAEPETDIGNARRFLHRHGDAALSIEGLGWAVFEGKRWVQDYFGAVVRPLAHSTVELIKLETAMIEPTVEEQALIDAGAEALMPWLEAKKKSKRTPDEERELMRLAAVVEAGEKAKGRIADRRAKRARYAKTSASSGKMDNMLGEAKVYRSRPVAVLDADPFAVNCENGTLRLFEHRFAANGAGATRTHGVGANGAGDTRTDGIWNVRFDLHRKADFISKLAPVAYDPDAECPLFEGFLETILPDDAVRQFVQRYLGYALTALTREQVFVFFYGSGRNGKSTLVDLICRLLGDYTTTVPFETLAGDDRRKGSEATPDLVRVPGARIVRASEPETGMKFRESMVKSLTSGEPILIRRMREEFIEVYPTFKLIISGNHRPDIRGGDDGIWRRVLLVPFEVQIPKDEVDRALPDKLWAERAGVLNWLIAGALSYLQEGLRVPDAVRGATDEYREQSDSYGGFLRAACEVTGFDHDTETPGDLYAAYRVYCERQGFFAVGVSTFNKAIPERTVQFGFRKAKTMGLSVYRGLRILDEFKPHSPSRTPGAGSSEG